MRRLLQILAVVVILIGIVLTINLLAYGTTNSVDLGKVILPDISKLATWNPTVPPRIPHLATWNPTVPPRIPHLATWNPTVPPRIPHLATWNPTVPPRIPH